MCNHNLGHYGDDDGDDLGDGDDGKIRFSPGGNVSPSVSIDNESLDRSIQACHHPRLRVHRIEMPAKQSTHDNSMGMIMLITNIGLVIIIITCIHQA